MSVNGPKTSSQFQLSGAAAGWDETNGFATEGLFPTFRQVSVTLAASSRCEKKDTRIGTTAKKEVRGFRTTLDVGMHVADVRHGWVS